MAGSRRQLMLIRCRWQHVFASLQEAAAGGSTFSQTFKKPLPAAARFRRPSRSRCRRQHVFASLQEAAADGSTFSQTFKKPLPTAARFRRPSRSRCRRQEVFVDPQKAAAGGLFYFLSDYNPNSTWKRNSQRL